MSQENVELVRTAYEFNLFTAAPDEVDRMFRDYAHEQLELRLPPDYPEGEQVFRGREGVFQLRAMLKEAWGAWRFEPEKFFDGGDCVVVFLRIVARGGASGVPIELETAHVWTVRSGRAISLDMYRDRSQALEAAGLRE